MATATAGENGRIFPVWKTITLGVHKTLGEYRKALRGAGCFIDRRANHLARQMSWDHKVSEVKLVVLAIGELGFVTQGGARHKYVYARAVEAGLKLCPAEVGLALRVAYKDQAHGEKLNIAMEPMPGSLAGLREVFAVARHSKRCKPRLTCGDGRPEYFWEADQRFVFCAPP